MPNNQGPPQEEPENYGLPANWQPISSAPINPNSSQGTPPNPSGVNPYGSSPLPQNLGYQPALVKTGYPSSTGPVDLMPIATTPQQNAKAQSTVREIISGGGTNSSGEVITFETNNNTNAVQDILNLIQGSNVILASDASGGVTISSASQVISVSGVAAPGSTVNLNGTTPAPASGTTNVIFQKDGGTPTTNVSAYMPLMVGDTGSGGVSGAVPAPPAGSAGAGKFLSANGGYAIPPGTGGASNYQTVELNTTPLTQQPTLNVISPLLAVNNGGNTSTDLSLPFFPGIVVHTRKNLASPVSLTGGTTTNIDSISVTFPSQGNTWFVRMSYYYSLDGVGDAFGWATDGVNTFAGCQASTATNRSGISASDLSPVTYASGSSKTFTVNATVISGGTAPTTTFGFSTSINCYLDIEVINAS